ncbi:MAG: hypothetical protein ACNI27_10450 [Desulfovibrio sp.]
MTYFPIKTLLVTTGVVLTGTVLYAASRSETLRPAFVGAVRTGIKATDWTSEKYNSVKEGMKDLVAEAKKENEFAATAQVENTPEPKEKAAVKTTTAKSKKTDA